MTRIPNTSPESTIYQALLIETICDIASSNTYPSPDHFILVTDADIQRKLGFLDHDKINGIPNVYLHMILAVSIIDCNLTGFLVDNGSSCNIL